MKKLQFLVLSLLVSLISSAQLSDLGQFLKNQPEIKKMELIQGNSFFNETWEIMVRQPLDHSDTTLGYFLQRVFVADKMKEDPVVLITEGYGANYAAMPRFINELSMILRSNQICIEHRYFGESWPEPLNWDYLTVQNAAADHHAITEMFKKYYTGKWINTGISKGGQTCVYHRTFYPEDVDVTVAYVAPLNFGVEDGRHEPFLKNVPGSAAQRKKIKEIQIELLKNREKLLPNLIEYANEKNYHFRIPMDAVFDYCVLEYPFALWQPGRYIDKIPGKDAGIDELFNHLMLVSPPSYFALEDMENIKSFFVQAARELGYYGYDDKPFKKYLSIESSKNYLYRIFLPEDLSIKYDKNTAIRVKKFIDTTSAEILFIYGEFDPWSASGFVVPQKNNLLKIVKPGGSHSSRIGNLPSEQRKQAIDKLEEWLQIPISAN